MQLVQEQSEIYHINDEYVASAALINPYRLQDMSDQQYRSFQQHLFFVVSCFDLSYKKKQALLEHFLTFNSSVDRVPAMYYRIFEEEAKEASMETEGFRIVHADKKYRAKQLIHQAACKTKDMMDNYLASIAVDFARYSEYCSNNEVIVDDEKVDELFDAIAMNVPQQRLMTMYGGAEVDLSIFQAFVSLYQNVREDPRF